MNGNGEMIDSACCSKVVSCGDTSTALHGYYSDLAKKQKVWGVNPVFSRHLVTFYSHLVRTHRHRLLSIRLHLCTEAVELSELFPAICCSKNRGSMNGGLVIVISWEVACYEGNSGINR